MQQRRSFKYKIAFGLTFLLGLLLFSNTAQHYSLMATNKLVCLASLEDLCGRIANQLSQYSAPDAAKIHAENCFQNKEALSCVNASIIYNRLKQTPPMLKTLARACELGDKQSCSATNKASQRWITESDQERLSAKEMRNRLEFVLGIYVRGCNFGEGESCALAARSPLSSAKSVYKYFYRGCYTLNHPTACIGLAEYFKSRGQSKLARSAVSKICGREKSLACTDLQQRMSDSQTAQMRSPTSKKKFN